MECGSRCPIYNEGNRFYADWRDEYGVRRRKAFVRKSDALAFDKEKKNESKKAKAETKHAR